MTELEAFIAERARMVEAKLDGLVPPEDAEPARLYKAIRWSLFGGGKRFRPVLMMAAGESFGAPAEKLLATAAAVEMIHTYSLIHDDLPSMDDDDLRRGRATCHKKFDEATAILAGDALQVLAIKAIAEDRELSESVRLKLVADLSAAAAQMVAGQQMDLEWEGREAGIDDVERIHTRKTGALIRFSAAAGARIAGAGENEIDAVAEYAGRLGLLFQITDDVLDVTQSTATLGKTAAKDIGSGKATYPSIYGMERTAALIGTVRDEAMAAIEGLGSSAGLLREIADLIVRRTS